MNNVRGNERGHEHVRVPVRVRVRVRIGEWGSVGMGESASSRVLTGRRGEVDMMDTRLSVIL